MGLYSKIENDLKAALKSGRGDEVSALRLIISAIKNREIEELKKETGLSDEEIIQVLRREAKKRLDAAHEFTKGNRTDLADRERGEVAIINTYLPQEISDEEIARIVGESLKQLGANGIAAFGSVMKHVMAEIKGRASGERVSQAVKKMLT